MQKNRRTVQPDGPHVLALVLEGPPDMLGLVLAQLPCRSLLSSACPVSHRFASAADEVCRVLCEVHGWKLPRSSRLAKQMGSGYRWRALYAAKACRECAAAPGDFPIRRWKQAPEFYLCGRCCKVPAVVSRLKERELTLDVTGLSGKPLYTKKGNSFAASVSAESEASLATASGARADRQRRAQPRGR